MDGYYEGLREAVKENRVIEYMMEKLPKHKVKMIDKNWKQNYQKFLYEEYNNGEPFDLNDFELRNKLIDKKCEELYKKKEIKEGQITTNDFEILGIIRPTLNGKILYQRILIRRIKRIDDEI